MFSLFKCRMSFLYVSGFWVLILTVSFCSILHCYVSSSVTMDRFQSFSYSLGRRIWIWGVVWVWVGWLVGLVHCYCCCFADKELHICCYFYMSLIGCAVLFLTLFSFHFLNFFTNCHSYMGSCVYLSLLSSGSLSFSWWDGCLRCVGMGEVETIHLLGSWKLIIVGWELGMIGLLQVYWLRLTYLVLLMKIAWCLLHGLHGGVCSGLIYLRRGSLLLIVSISWVRVVRWDRFGVFAVVAALVRCEEGVLAFRPFCFVVALHPWFDWVHYYSLA